jgi:hypothetical protein
MMLPMYIEAVPNRGSPPAILLRESYREAGKVKKRTLLNLSDWPHERIAGFKALLKGGTVIPQDRDAITIIRSLPHGHVDAALGTARKIGLDRLLGPDGNRCRNLILALVVNRILDPGSKLAAARALSPDTATSSLGEQLALGVVDEDELYSALDWLAVRQPSIEAALAKRHFTGGTLVLYDVSSSYLEGRCCPLAQFGYSRDGKRGKLQIVYGLLCAPDGCPVAIEVFAGSTADPATLTSQVIKLKERFGLDHVVLVGDRGMITQARISEDLKAAGLDWITALRAPAIKALLDGGALQMSLFDDRDMAGITSPEFPGERRDVGQGLPGAVWVRRQRGEQVGISEPADLVVETSRAGCRRGGPESRGWRRSPAPVPAPHGVGGDVDLALDDRVAGDQLLHDRQGIAGLVVIVRGCAGPPAALQVNLNKRTPELERAHLAIRHPPAGRQRVRPAPGMAGNQATILAHQRRRRPTPLLDARRDRGDLGIRVGPCIFRVWDQPIDRPALDLIGRPRPLISGNLSRAGARDGGSVGADEICGPMGRAVLDELVESGLAVRGPSL